jgi:hypothetical protein
MQFTEPSSRGAQGSRPSPTAYRRPEMARWVVVATRESATKANSVGTAPKAERLSPARRTPATTVATVPVTSASRGRIGASIDPVVVALLTYAARVLHTLSRPRGQRRNGNNAQSRRKQWKRSPPETLAHSGQRGERHDHRAQDPWKCYTVKRAANTRALKGFARAVVVLPTVPPTTRKHKSAPLTQTVRRESDPSTKPVVHDQQTSVGRLEFELTVTASNASVKRSLGAGGDSARAGSCAHAQAPPTLAWVRATRRAR